MFGFGLPEILLIFVIALVVFGPKKLPEIGRSIGRALAEFKRASEEFQESMRAEMRDVEKTSRLEELKKIGDEMNQIATKEVSATQTSPTDQDKDKVIDTGKEKENQDKEKA